MRWVLGYASALCVLILIVCTSIAFPTFFKPFYSHEYNKYNVPSTIRVEKDELMTVTSHLLNYMHGRRDDLIIPSVVNGEPCEFFNQREKDHMSDVRALFDTGFKVRNVAFWFLLLLILIMIFFKVRIPYVMARCCREVLVGFLLLAIILIAVIALDFDRAFNMFHMLFFTNDLWQLNPETDLLINMVPLEFFMDIALFIGGLLLTLSLAVIAAGSVYIRRVSRMERYPER